MQNLLCSVLLLVRESPSVYTTGVVSLSLLYAGTGSRETSEVVDWVLLYSTSWLLSLL